MKVMEKIFSKSHLKISFISFKHTRSYSRTFNKTFSVLETSFAFPLFFLGPHLLFGVFMKLAIISLTVIIDGI